MGKSLRALGVSASFCAEQMCTPAMAFMPSKNVSMKALWFWFFLLLFSVFVSGDGQVHKVQYKVGEKAVLLFPYELDSPKTFRVYWQKDEKSEKGEKVEKVVIALTNGKEDKVFQDAEYINRTTLVTGNLSLVFLYTKVMDEGLYKCVVLQMNSKKSYEHKYSLSVQLSLVAEFSKPIINAFRITSGNILLVNLTCSSHGGYPEPRIFWNSSKENPALQGSILNSTVSLKDPWTGLYNVSSMLILNVTETLHLSCSVAYTGFQTDSDYLIISEPDKLSTRAPSLQNRTDGRQHEVLIATGVILACVLLMSLAMLKKYIVRNTPEDPENQIHLSQTSTALPVVEHAKVADTMKRSEAQALGVEHEMGLQRETEDGGSNLPEWTPEFVLPSTTTKPL
ncbi:T-lymphocyte activation antigen CD80 [Microcaecilia unicolor]|uniref:T-lymphocyte activation antigen CD80-like n=1 Tax=Microcaecilia unicolor TaxID=1415580 RepID=A0A6P7YCW6_9AMPH|nr:T-lymphocyte activation antigen CD80-like [Microcaecilia unicolor]